MMASAWWDANRPKVPDAFREEMERALVLVSVQPQIETKARNVELTGGLIQLGDEDMHRRVGIKTAVELSRIFWPDFAEVDGSVFVPWVRIVRTSDPENGLDLTGMEAFHNHTHIIDLFKHEAGREPDEKDDCFFDYNHPDFALLCEVGKKLAQMWFLKLKVDFPHYRFRVYYTQEDNPIVRFHRVRAGEPYWLNEGMCVEDVKLGKVIVYDTGEPREGAKARETQEP